MPEPFHVRVFGQEPPDDFTEHADPLAVHDPHVQDPRRPAFRHPASPALPPSSVAL